MGLGTIVNVIAVLAGSTVGMFLKGGISKRFQDIVMQAIGLSTMFIGISGALSGMMTITGEGLSSQYTMLMIASLIIGGFIGEAVDIEKRLEQLGEKCKKLIPSSGSDKTGQFVEGFVTSSLLFCVGAMAIVGSLEDGLNHNYTTLFAKSIMDGVMSVVFAASLGIGVYFSIIPLIIYQGGITVLAGFIRPYLSDTVIAQMSMVGSILIFGIGINLIFGKKIKLGNLLPAMFIPIFWQFVFK